MMRGAASLTVLLLAFTGNGEAKPGMRTKQTIPVPASEPEKIPSPIGDDATDLPILAGLTLRNDGPRLRVFHVLPDSTGSDIGLENGDILLHLNGTPISKISDVASALAAWPSGTRLSAVVERGMRLVRLSPKTPRPALPEPRSATALSPREAAFRDAHLEKAKTFTTPPEVTAAGFQIAAGEKIWIRFPKGIPHTAEAGDILEGVTSTSLSTDSDLDFLAIPQESRMWAQVVSVGEDEEDVTRLVKLHVYKIALRGGHTYPASAILVKASGNQSLLRVSEGGTVIGAIIPESAHLADPEKNFQLKFIEPISIWEKSEFYQAGPGLWMRSVDANGRKWFEVTHIIQGRSADYAGLKTGERISRINGVPANHLTFTEGIRALYGDVGTEVKLDVVSGVKDKPRSLGLKRGTLYKKGLGMSARRQGRTIRVTSVAPESPAARAGIREGFQLIQIGQQHLEDLTRNELKDLLGKDLTGENALIVQPPGKSMRTIEINRELFPERLIFQPGKPSPAKKKEETKAEEPPSSSPPAPDAPRKPQDRSAGTRRKKP